MTTIRWTDKTWNFIVGCSLKSAGCTNCYAARMAWRLQHNFGIPHYKGTTSFRTRQFTGWVNLAPQHIMEAPLRRTKPTMYFVNSMSDWLHENVQLDWLDAAFAICERSPQHVFQWLTKRPERMAAVLDQIGRQRVPENCWMGVTVEGSNIDPTTRLPVTERIRILRNSVDARYRWISFEPLVSDPGRLDLTGIHWAVVGGESGPGARQMRPEWARSVIEQSRAAGLAVHFKQWGTFKGANPDPTDPSIAHKGGHRIDGRFWNEFPDGIERVLKA
jgi:protein gp37